MPKGIYQRDNKRISGKYAVGTLHKTSQGVLRILEQLEAPYVLAIFQCTGYVCKVRTSNIVADRVKNHRLPSVYGVGYLDGMRIPPRGCEGRRIYDLWANMLKRCYGGYDSSYDGCTVDPRWHSYRQFLNSIMDLPGYLEFCAGADVHLDKDILIPGNKVYSAVACRFVPASENIRDSSVRRWARK